MRTRREVLMLGGAGVTAIALPTYGFPGFGLAQGRGGAAAAARPTGPDPMLAELASQFRRALTGLAAPLPRGNARELAALYRMASAWARANNIDAQLRQSLDAALASEGHHAVVTRLGSVDYVANAKKLGIPLPPNMRNPDATTFAKAIGWMKAGMTYERAWRIAASQMESKAAQFDRMMAIANRRNPTDATIRLIQDPACTDPDCSSVEFPPDGDCKRLPDGSFACEFVATAPSPTAPNGEPVPDQQTCKNIEFITDLWSVGWAFLCLLLIEFCWLGLLNEGVWNWWQWYIGC